MTNGNDFASPSHKKEYMPTPFLTGGLTKREYFAARNLSALLSNPKIISDVNFEFGKAADMAAIAADALIKSLNETKCNPQSQSS